MNVRVALVVVLASLVVYLPSAGAEPQGKLAVIESRIGPPRAVADDVSLLIRSEFEAEGMAATPEAVADALGPRMPRPGRTDQPLTVTEALAPLQQGYLEWSRGQFVAAETSLRRGLATHRENPALLATDTKNLDTLFRGMVALMLTEWQLAKGATDRGRLDAARDAAFEVIRVFRSRPLGRDEYSPDAIEYHRKITKEANAQSHGQVFVEVDDEHVMVFIDAQMHGVGRAALADSVPGVYHVFLQVPSRSEPGRRYELAVHPNEDATLKVRWAIDSAFYATATWIGFAFTTEAEHARQAAYAAEAARWSSRGEIVVVERTQTDGQPALRGTRYSANGDEARPGSVVMGADPRAAVRQLARYLADGTRGDAVVVEASVAVKSARAEAVAHTPETAKRSLVGPVVTGVGAAAMIGGWIYFATATTSVPVASLSYRDPKRAPIGVTLAGCAVLGAGTALWLRDHDVGVLPATLLGAGATALFAGGFLALTDEDDTGEKPQYRDTATGGVVLGVVGVTSLAAGWLLARRGAAITPIVQPKDHTVTLGVAGAW